MTARSLMEEAQSYYSDLKWSEGPLQEELVSKDDMVWVKAYRKTPMTIGFEIEQRRGHICRALERRYKWHRDLSGPYETDFPPSAFPGVELKKFVDFCKEHEGCTWRWENQYEFYGEQKGCGSHIHFRLREDVEKIAQNWTEAWTTTHNTLIECVPLLAPMFAYGGGGVFSFRESALRWSPITTRRLSPASMTEYLQPSYTGHPYGTVALNKRDDPRPKPLTIELRLNETHPTLAYQLSTFLSRIVRRSIDRGFVSPKMKDRGHILNDIRIAIEYSINQEVSLYERMAEIGDRRGIEFYSGREIPGLQTSYPGWDELFDDIIRTYGDPYPPMARVCRFFLHRGEPYKNPNAVWDVFEPHGQFCWDQRRIPSR